MIPAISALLRDPALRLVTLLLFCIGAFVGTIAPYSSILAVQVFGLGDRGYAAVLISASAVTVSASLYAGILTDQRANRRAVAIVCAAGSLCGILAVCVFRSAPAFVLAHAVLIPVGGALYGQVFALARLAAAHHPPRERDAILTTVRALFALPFILILPVISIAIRRGMPVPAVYAVLLVLAALILGLILARWPRDGATAWSDTRSGLSLRSALAEIGRPAVSVRVALTGIINGGSTMYMAVTGLIFTTTGHRPEGDVALFVGLVAGLEVPVMLMTPWLMRHASKTALIAGGAAVYAIHLSLIAPLAATPLVWALVIPAAIGGAVYISVPIAYLQDLMADRPGAGSSLLAVQRIAGDAACALAFVIGTTVSGYGLAAALGAAAAIAAGLCLLWIDRDRSPSALSASQRTP